MGGDEVATKLLKDKETLQIIVITADEKTTKRVNKTISAAYLHLFKNPSLLMKSKKQ